MYKKMCMRRLEPTDTTYTALISAYAKADRVEDALAAYKIMLSSPYNLPIMCTPHAAMSAVCCM